MSTVFLTIAVIVVIAVVIARRFHGAPVDAKDLVVPPIILLALSIKDLAGFHHWTPANIVFLCASIIVGLGFGFLRGSTTVLFSRNRTLHQRYTVKTLVVWAISLAAGFGLTLGAQAIGAEEAVRPMTLSIGLSLFGEMLSCGIRGVRTGIPFSVREDSRAESSRVGSSASGLSRSISSQPDSSQPDSSRSESSLIDDFAALLSRSRRSGDPRRR